MIRMRCFTVAVTLLVAFTIDTSACTAGPPAGSATTRAINPFIGHLGYPQWRGVTGLGGTGYGLDADGYGSLGGAISYSTPIAYTLGHGEWELEGGQLAFNATPNLNWQGTNGSLFLSGGFTTGQFNIAGTYFVKSTAGDQSYDLQVEYLPSPSSPIAYSLGVIDLLGHDPASGNALDPDNSRSIFAVATYRMPTGGNPIYISAGAGTNRYSPVFANTSYQFMKNIRAWAEYDGFGVNEGLAFAWKLAPGRKGVILTLQAGFNDFQYATYSLGVTF